MKKILFLILVLFSINSFAVWVSKSKLLNEDCKVARPTYSKKKECDKLNSDCIPFIKIFKCETFSELDTEVDDPMRPIYSKMEIESCIGEEQCQEFYVRKTCQDPDENPILRLDTYEVYCSKLIGYDQMTEQIIREDPVKKAAYDLNQAKILLRNTRKSNGKKSREACNEVLDLIAGFNLERSLTTTQIDQLKSLFSGAKDYLKDGQPWASKSAIEAITPDEVLVTTEMKEAILDEFSKTGLPGL